MSTTTGHPASAREGFYEHEGFGQLSRKRKVGRGRTKMLTILFSSSWDMKLPSASDLHVSPSTATAHHVQSSTVPGKAVVGGGSVYPSTREARTNADRAAKTDMRAIAGQETAKDADELNKECRLLRCCQGVTIN